MPLLLKLAVIFSLSVSVWAQSDSALARQSDSELAWHKEADNPQAAQFLQPFVPLDINTYALEPISIGLQASTVSKGEIIVSSSLRA